MNKAGLLTGILTVRDLEGSKGALVDGKRIHEIPFPRGCMAASVRRRGQVFIPHGNTMLHAGDVLVVLAEGPAREKVIILCRKTDPV